MNFIKQSSTKVAYEKGKMTTFETKNLSAFEAMRHREVKRVVEMVPRRELKQDKRPRSASAGRDPQASK